MFEPIFEALNSVNARYVVVGGVAVVLHGHPRLTADLDLVVDLAPGEARKVVDALVGLGLRPTAPVDPALFADPHVRTRWVTEKGMLVFSLRDPNDPLRQIDLFVQEPIPFETLWEGAREIDVAGTPVRIASIEDLITMKRAAGRAQDLADIDALERLAEEEL